jgi:hypothetical protein
MAFGYEYLMVYLPEFNPESFLLFVHSPAGSSKLRDYSGGREKVVGQPPLSMVRNATVGGETRFKVDPHTVTGEDGNGYWSLRTSEYNLRYLGVARGSGVRGNNDPVPARRTERVRNGIHGRAIRGSQKQLQDYVNERQDVLSKALLEALPAKLRESVTAVRWVSPLESEDYAEYRDADFLHAIGLGEFTRDLASFWPSLGPLWDGLAVLSTSFANSRPVVILVEAKSHIPEIYGNGCQASATSRILIEKSLATAKRWCGAKEEADWTGPLYQSANRLAHLYFIREHLKRSAWLINLYFTEDPYRPTNLDEWHKEIRNVQNVLGLTTDVVGVIELFLPALSTHLPSQSISVIEAETLSGRGGQDEFSQYGVSSSRPSEGSDDDNGTAQSDVAQWTLGETSADQQLETFARWRDRWTVLAEYQSNSIPGIQHRIDQLVSLWKEPIPGAWQRGIDPQLLFVRYRRGDLHNPHPGEHSIEHEILCGNFERVSCFGYKLVDGVNAFPLSRDTRGIGRRGNVEADMLLLGELDGAYRLFLCEVKDRANDPWYAVVESLRQLRLFIENEKSRNVFADRGSVSKLPAVIPVTGLVVAPVHYYLSRGKRLNAVKPVLQVIQRFTSEFAVDIRLATWDAKRHQIEGLQHN